MTAFSQSLLQQLDVNGAPLSGWTVGFFVSGTNTPVTVYKDAALASPHAKPVRADGQGRLPTIYFLSDGIKLRADITLPDGRVKSIDGIDPGSPASPTTGTAEPLLPAVSKTGTTVTLTADDWGRLVDIVTSSGTTVAVILPKASLITNGRLAAIRNFGSGSVIVRTQGSDLVNERKSFLLTNQDECAVVASTGAGFELIARTPPSPSRFVVTSRTVTTPPTGAAAGVSYLAPVGATDAWAPNAVYTADGVGGWLRHDPAVGDEVIVSGETFTVGTGTLVPVRLLWTGSEWIDETVLALHETVLHVRGEYASGTSSATAYALGAGTAPVNTYTQVRLNTTISNAITGATINANLITLPKGSYVIRATHKFHGAIAARLKFRSTSTLTALSGPPRLIPASTEEQVEVSGRIVVTAATETFELVYIIAGTPDALTLGTAAAIAGEGEVYGELLVETL